jgi:hypothetical protein
MIGEKVERQREWVWGDEVEYTPEQIEEKVVMLEHLINNSHYHSTADWFDNGKSGWTQEELQAELNKLIKENNG